MEDEDKYERYLLTNMSTSGMPSTVLALDVDHEVISTIGRARPVMADGDTVIQSRL